eukprot:955558-Prorocentrum_minimum.AAC.1
MDVITDMNEGLDEVHEGTPAEAEPLSGAEDAIMKSPGSKNVPGDDEIQEYSDPDDEALPKLGDWLKKGNASEQAAGSEHGDDSERERVDPGPRHARDNDIPNYAASMRTAREAAGSGALQHAGAEDIPKKHKGAAKKPRVKRIPVAYEDELTPEEPFRGELADVVDRYMAPNRVYEAERHSALK